MFPVLMFQGNSGTRMTRTDTFSDPSPIVDTDRNAWRVARADRLAFLVDGDAYYRQVEAALMQARRSIWIVGWDFDPDIRLQPQNEGAMTLGELLRSRVEALPDLDVRILVWGEGPVYSSGRIPVLQDTQWCEHPRIALHYDFEHPLRASHHQKLLVIDEELAFVGGIDLTSQRWDTSDHVAQNPLRCRPNGDPYGPVHDIQVALSGEGARVVADVVRRRWGRAVPDELPSAEAPGETWPDELEPDLTGCDIAIALAEAGGSDHKRRTDPIQLTCDAIDAARESIYIETQYLVSTRVVRHLTARLREPGGPEVVILVTRDTRGLLEQWTMGYGRTLAIRRLMRANGEGRLRIAYAVVPDGEGGEQEVLIHAKLVIVDDRFVRVGSSNLNNRSEGFDTECDLAIEAPSAGEGAGEGEAQGEACRQAIVRLRNSLLAEHLDADPAAVERVIARTGSLTAVIDELNVNERGLRPYRVNPRKRAGLLHLGSGIVDPKRRYWPLQRFREVGSFAAARLTGMLKAWF